MTEKNADVEWLRAELEAWKGFSPENCAFRLNLGYFRRLLAYIDQLEARLAEPFPQIPRAPEYRPTIHEIAPMLVAALLACVDKERECRWSALAADAYRGAEALVAEGRRRDGQGS